jgi:NAD+ kinase
MGFSISASHPQPMQVGIVAQRGNTRAQSLVEDLCRELDADDVEVRIDPETRAVLDHMEVWAKDDQSVLQPPALPVDRMDEADLVVSVGGDGTFLFTARGAGATPIMGVNLGEVGFLNAVPPEEGVETVLETVQRIRESGSARTRDLPRIRAHGEGWDLPAALNEVTVMGENRGHGRGIGVEVRIDGDLYTSGHADGVLVATPTGSTAYNLSEGGPIVHPALSSFVVTEMCPADGMKPLVIDADKAVTVRIDSGDEAVAVSDGRIVETLSPPAEVHLTRAPDPVRIAGPPLNFFTALGKLA